MFKQSIYVQPGAHSWGAVFGTAASVVAGVATVAQMVPQAMPYVGWLSALAAGLAAIGSKLP